MPDALINPSHSALTALEGLRVLDAGGYGVLQLPPPGEYPLLLAVIADQVVEYSHHGYAVVAIGVHGQPGDGLHWRRLAQLLRHRDVPLPPRHIIRAEAVVEVQRERQRLAVFLAGQDISVEEQRRWRS